MRRLVVSALAIALLATGLGLAPGVTGAAPGALMVDTTATLDSGTPDTTGAVESTDTSVLSADRGPSEQVDTTLPPPNTGTGKRAVFSIAQQRVWVFSDDSTIIRTFLVSARLDMPNPGTYKVWSRSLYACSSGHRWICMRYMIRFAKGPAGGHIGFHEIPRDTRAPGDPGVQTEEQLGQPLSRVCLPPRPAHADLMWRWCAIGHDVRVSP